MRYEAYAVLKSRNRMCSAESGPLKSLGGGANCLR